MSLLAACRCRNGLRIHERDLCGGNRRVASQLVVASFIFSIFSIPAFIYLFNRFFPTPL
jgi:predicted permease